jgi:hypothetical protein
MVEVERSKTLVADVTDFRTKLILRIVELARLFAQDLCISFSSLLRLLDSTVRLDLLAIPPGFAVPKKRLTLKRMRKAQRTRDAIAGGAEDRSKRRVWPALELSSLALTVQAVEPLVPEDQFPTFQPQEAQEEAPAKGKKPAKKGKGAAEPEPEAAPKSLVPEEWSKPLQKASAVDALVSSAHRRLLQQRDGELSEFVSVLAEELEVVREEYALVLSQENSWHERWNRQVEMLRNS